ncbi:PD-(D/E)XK nuclease family protein [Carboxylicivirga sp. A043]|uniref:PD-(D/E)XK nuclease family protein n=1 Tax=Carboxylicivirga litoralis TaxID=2816963 RepID=UPI0021CB39A4|nr:PD-(D/E)XK nuclease family protein [Carboxylicivirga sp. A043]MCU4158398.1 PD-(D/E)XK nuclease family protein [Carboxylicivirga sp. A043]
MESVFSRAYSYRERKSKNNLENYLIEVFSFCLGSDSKFLNSFLELIDMPNGDGYSINTQSTYKEGRPDIVIENESTFIIIECKIEAPERFNQLKDYSKIVNRNSKKNKKLIYLTKYYQYKEIKNYTGEYQNIKWVDVAKCIIDNNNDITKELKKFLSEKNIAMENKLTTQDLVTLDGIPSSISKMDEIIESVKDYFEQKIGKLSKPSSRSTWLSSAAYFNNFKISKTMAVDLGFMWWWGDGKIYLSVRIYIAKSDANYNKKKDFFQKKLDEWEIEEDDKEYVVGNYLNINEIIAVEEDQLEAMIEFMKENIDVVSELKKQNGDFFK